MSDGLSLDEVMAIIDNLENRDKTEVFIRIMVDMAIYVDEYGKQDEMEEYLMARAEDEARRRGL